MAHSPSIHLPCPPLSLSSFPSLRPVSVALLRAQQRAAIEAAYLDTMCVKIQKCYRGHYSRLHYADFYRRRLYLQHVTAQGEQLTQAVSHSAALLHHISAAARDQAHREQVHDVLTHTHHLLSTASIPGVFASKWGPAYESTVDGVPVESVIQRLWKERQGQLRRLREDIRRERKRRDLHQRRDVTEMRITRDGDSFDGVPMVEVVQEEAKVQLMEDEGEQEREVDRLVFDVEQVSSESRGQSQQGRRGDDYVRFPPIHPKAAFAESEAMMKQVEDEEREVLALNRSIILSRDGRPVTVERPRHNSR
jgi:hypothetical protein